MMGGLPSFYSLKPHLDVKLFNVPPHKDIICESIRNLNHRHLQKTCLVFGTVVRTGNVGSRELAKLFQCTKCGK